MSKICMSRVGRCSTGAIVLLAVILAGSPAVAQEEPDGAVQKVAAPGLYVRQAASNEGLAVLGFRAANQSVGARFLGLDFAVTVFKGYKTELPRENIALRLPDDTQLQLLSREEFMANRSELAAINRRANVQSDSINYMPNKTADVCLLSFFADPLERSSVLMRDKASLDSTVACTGGLYFDTPDGVQYGQHFLIVKIIDEEIVLPFKIMTKEESKEAAAKLKQMRKDAKAKKKAEKAAAKAGD